MGINFKPSGSLDIATNPTDLPDDGLARCKNLRLDHTGIVKTRDGSTKINDTALAQTGIHRIIEQAGVRFTFSGSVLYRDEMAIETGLTDAAWTAIAYNSYASENQNIFAVNGTETIRIEGSSTYDFGIDAPASAPSIVGSIGGGNVTGEVSVKYTYARYETDSDGDLILVSESNSSPVSNTVSVIDGAVTVTADASADTQVTHIRFYRTSGDGTSWYYAGKVAIDLTTYTYSYAHDWEATDAYISGIGKKFTTEDTTNERDYIHTWESDIDKIFYDGIAEHAFASYEVMLDDDSSLGAELETTHYRPKDMEAVGSVVFGPSYNGTCFMLVNNLLYYCLPKQPEYWPATYFIEVSIKQFPLRAGCFYNGQPFVFSQNDIFLIQGTGHNSFFPHTMSALTGAQNSDGALPIAGMGILHTGSDGIYLFDGAIDKKMTFGTFEPIFRGEATNGMPGVSDMTKSWLIQFKGKVYFGYVSTDYTYPTNIIVINLANMRASYYNYNNNEIRTVTVDKTNERLLAGDNSGYIWELEDKTATDDGGTAILWEIESKEFTLQTRAHFPRWAKYDVDASDSLCTANGYIMLNGVPVQTHSLTEDRNTRYRLITPSNGERLSHRLSGSGVVKIYAIESE